MKSVREALRVARPALLGAAVLSGLVNVLTLTGSFYMVQIYDRVLPSRSVPTLVGFTVLLVILFIAYGAVDLVRVRVMSRIGLGLDRMLRPDVIRAAFHLPFQSWPAGASRAPLRDLEQFRAFFSSLGPTALFDFPWLPAYVVLIWLLHPSLGVFAVVGALLLVSLALVTEWRSRKHAVVAQKSVSARQALETTVRRNSESMRAMGFEGRLSEQWDRLHNRHLDSQLSLSDVSLGFGTLSKILRLLLQSGILGLGAYLAIHGELSAGTLIACSIVLSRALAPIEVAITHWRGFVAMRQSARSLDALLGALPASETPMPLPPPKAFLDVAKLSAATTGPPPTPILSNISFRLDAGDGLAIIGPSGSGKSTLVRCLVGAWGAGSVSGDVRLDGATLSQYGREELGRHIGYMSQAVDLLDGTVAENIARFDPRAESADIVAAAERAGVHQVILELPNGYDTRLGEGGFRLSAGQLQRVTLARALYREPFLVVLDEPNSNMDAVGELALIDSFKQIRERGGIVIVVAHRPSLLATLNKVLVLSKGQMQAFGNREDVLKQVLHVVPNQGARPGEAQGAGSGGTAGVAAAPGAQRTISDAREMADE